MEQRWKKELEDAGWKGQNCSESN